MRHPITLAVALALCACRSEAPPATPAAPAQADKPAAATPKAPEKAAPVALTEGEQWTPFAFAGQWAKLDALPDSMPAKEKLAAQMQAHWQGKKLRWTGAAMASLCVMAERKCAVNPFERTQTPKVERLGGFFPMVHFTEPAFARLREGCKDQTRCVIGFEGTLGAVRTEPGRPLALTFEGATVLEARQATAEEKWFGRPTPKVNRGTKGKKLSTGKPTVVKLDALVRKTF